MELLLQICMSSRGAERVYTYSSLKRQTLASCTPYLGVRFNLNVSEALANALLPMLPGYAEASA